MDKGPRLRERLALARANQCWLIAVLRGDISLLVGFNCLLYTSIDLLMLKQRTAVFVFTRPFVNFSFKSTSFQVSKVFRTLHVFGNQIARYFDDSIVRFRLYLLYNDDELEECQLMK